MDQICPILCDNWETKFHTNPLPFQNSFGIAINVKISIENFSFFQGWATNRAIFSEWIGQQNQLILAYTFLDSTYFLTKVQAKNIHATSLTWYVFWPSGSSPKNVKIVVVVLGDLWHFSRIDENLVEQNLTSFYKILAWRNLLWFYVLWREKLDILKQVLRILKALQILEVWRYLKSWKSWKSWKNLKRVLKKKVLIRRLGLNCFSVLLFAIFV